MTGLNHRPLPTLDIHGAFVPGTNWDSTVLLKANLSGTDATRATFRGADFLNANLDGTILSGADLTGARNLTEEQLSRAVIDEATRLPDYIDRDRIAALRGANDAAAE